MPLAAIVGKLVETIEGSASDASQALQKAWLEHDVPQCRYCQSEQIMSVVALLQEYPDPDDATINNYMQGNIGCCGTYLRIKTVIESVAQQQFSHYTLGKNMRVKA
jgi:isoquinoline 1-oxidoreductase alpha subunit